MFSLLQVDFANRYVGGGVLRRGAVQVFNYFVHLKLDIIVSAWFFIFNRKRFVSAFHRNSSSRACSNFRLKTTKRFSCEASRTSRDTEATHRRSSTMDLTTIQHTWAIARIISIITQLLRVSYENCCCFCLHVVGQGRRFAEFYDNHWCTTL